MQDFNPLDPSNVLALYSPSAPAVGPLTPSCDAYQNDGMPTASPLRPGSPNCRHEAGPRTVAAPAALALPHWLPWRTNAARCHLALAGAEKGILCSRIGRRSRSPAELDVTQQRGL